MACERFRDALADVAAGEPAPASVEAHLASCEACRAALVTLRRALAVADEELAGLAAAGPSPGLAARILRGVGKSSSVASPAFRLTWLWPVTAAAVAVLVGLTVWPGRTPVVSPETGSSAVGVAIGPDARVPVVPRDTLTSGSAGAAVPEGPRAPGLAPRRPRATSAGAAHAAAHGRTRGSAAPAVLLPPGNREAFLRLVALVHRDRLALTGLTAPGPPSPEFTGPAPLDIPPLEIVPLERESPETSLSHEEET